MSQSPVETGDNSPEETAEIALKRETEKQRAKRYAAAWSATLATEQGRAVIWDILAQGGLIAAAYTQGDPMHTAYLSGRREFVLNLYKTLATDYPARLLQMEKENMR